MEVSAVAVSGLVWVDPDFLESVPVGLCFVDEGGCVLASNDLFGCYANFGPPESVLGRPLAGLVPGGDRARIAAALADARRSDHSVLLATDGSDEPCRNWGGFIAPIRQGSDKIAGFLLAVWNRKRELLIETRAAELAATNAAVNERLALTALQAQEAAERAEEARRQADEQSAQLDSIFAAIRDIVLVFGPDGTVVKTNPAALVAFGFDPVGLDTATIVRRLRLRRLDGTEMRTDEVSATRVLRGKSSSPKPFVFTAADQREHIVESSSAAVGGADLGAVSVWHDVTEREQLLAALREKTGELEEADRRKNEFLAVLGHELRNPLAAIMNSCYLLKRPTVTGERREHFLDIVTGQTRQLRRIVDDLLDISRIIQGRLELKRETVDLREIIQRAIDAVHPTIEDRRHQLTITVPGEALIAEGDPARLQQVIFNLLQNAAKYTPSSGNIHLRVECDGDMLLLRLSDSGVGISPELLPRIFDVFARGTDALVRQHAGLGIGLPLARTLVEMHGGTIQAFSEGSGRGAEFEVHLPILPEHTGPTAEDPAETCAVPSRRVLIVEDNPQVAESLAEILTTFGHSVQLAHGGEEGIRAALEQRPDFVLIDIGLPDIDGYEVARRVRVQSRPGAQPRLVAITGYGQEEDRARAEEAGFHVHLVKPADPLRLQRILASS